MFNSSTSELLKEEALLDETLRHLMIRNHGAYTLFGVKPITLFLEGDGQIDREKEMKEFFQFPPEAQKRYRKIKKKEYRTLPQYLKKKYSEEDVFFSDYHWKELWKFWEEHWEEYTGDRYFFLLKKESNFGRLFVNVNEVIYHLYRYYDDFKKVAGRDFSPEQVLKELKQGISEFWESVFASDYLAGLLFGYGEKSSLLFRIKSDEKINRLSYVIDSKKNGWNLHKAYLDISDLAIPEFKLFSLYDEQLTNFQRERDRIINFYSEGDFVTKTLSLLRQEDHILLDAVSGKTIQIKNPLKMD